MNFHRILLANWDRLIEYNNFLTVNYEWLQNIKKVPPSDLHEAALLSSKFLFQSILISVKSVSSLHRREMNDVCVYRTANRNWLIEWYRHRRSSLDGVTKGYFHFRLIAEKFLRNIKGKLSRALTVWWWFYFVSATFDGGRSWFVAIL